METILSVSVTVLALLVIASEMYKISFERKIEAKDERGQLLLLRVKNSSYYILVVGIILGAILVRSVEVLAQEDYIYFIMVVFFIQSIVSSGYLFLLRRV
ncbi:hypothetical protein [Alteribacter populi]|uniref:hypothetical protein n=1 Tax=Alteribacter populi TaxID=2011011 RepID=UPI000BBAA44D|nr:hypothetical protein [Alteribacter populi]